MVSHDSKALPCSVWFVALRANSANRISSERSVSAGLKGKWRITSLECGPCDGCGLHEQKLLEITADYTYITMKTLPTCTLPGAGVQTARASSSVRQCRSRVLPVRKFRAFAAPPRSVRAHRSACHRVISAAASKADSEDHLQLATAKLPKYSVQAASLNQPETNERVC